MDGNLKLPKPPAGFYWRVKRPGWADIYGRLQLVKSVTFLGVTWGRVYNERLVSHRDANEKVGMSARFILQETFPVETPTSPYGTYYKEDTL